MVTGVLSFRPAVVVVRASVDAVGVRKSDKVTRHTSVSPKWWAPLFGFSSEPNYIISEDKKSKLAVEGDPKPARFRIEPVALTEEKARQLRRMTNDATSFHDSMYHSAVASRLAFDFSDRTAVP
ncbi:hypothetical protein ACS0TY_032793 [Phlomoides rotata]